MVDLVADAAAKAQSSLFTLPSMTRLLVDTDIALVHDAIADVQRKEGQPPLEETRRSFTLAQHTTFVQLTRILMHLRTMLQTSDKLAMNLLQALEPMIHDVPLHPAELSRTASRSQVLLLFLYHCHPHRVLGFFFLTCTAPQDKASTLRNLVSVRDVALHLVRTASLSTATTTTTPHATLWFQLLSHTVDCAKSFTATGGEHGRRGPTKLSLAAADASLAIIHVAALSIGRNDEEGSASSVVGPLKELIAQLLDELVEWYTGVRHRTLFVVALVSFRTATCTSTEWVDHIHHSIPVFQSAFPHSTRLLSRMISQLRLHPTEPALRNVVCALGRVRPSKLSHAMHCQLVNVAVDAMRASASSEATFLATTIVEFVICQHWITHGLLSPPWEWVYPVERALVDGAALIPATPAIADIVRVTNVPVATLKMVLEATDTSKSVLRNALTLVQYMMSESPPQSLVWSALLGTGVVRSSPSSVIATAKQLTMPVLMLCDHHPCIGIRRQAAKLLSALDMSTIVAHYMARLPSSHADTILAYLVASRTASRVAVGTIVAAILNLGFPAFATLPIQSPADIQPVQGSSQSSAPAKRQAALQALTRWLERVPPSSVDAISDDLIATFFQSSHDSISMVVLREFLRLYPATFSRQLPVLQSRLQPHVGVVYESSSPLLLVKLRPLLALRLAPVSCLSNVASSLVQMVVALVSEDGESEDIRKLAADIVAKLPPRTAFPLILQRLQPLLAPVAPPGAWAALSAWNTLPPLASSAKTTSLMVYCATVFVAAHPESQPMWLGPVLELVLMAWAARVPSASQSSDLVERVQRGCIECMTVLMHHSSIHASHTTFEQWVQSWLEGTFDGRMNMLETQRLLELPARLCCCNVLLNAIPRLDKTALCTLASQSLPYIHACLAKDTSPAVLQSASLKLLMTLAKYHAFNDNFAQSVGTDVVDATAKLVASAQNTQVRPFPMPM
ncbi:hypothetical protein, variant 3 [Aphanomyces invadans]|uniref:Uncharacterized protein n=1 Tax=Aphanomyces invadans TaxID=157072 RepID=A0A024TYI8_9STRA|nr:hypothetical protein, variant 2 [Aphanomyces invadans]XP_008871786.1 hypothetical protein, variant 3 [Aphanomyces invadans]ETV99229.1 hypothetical protein, variant 2 [Aphanomyces invadans]ETV99230.1 hypothetical protein, variant 3 [Aphanomyces invadans]|eukprot:XP_008871785.1 hypothetical protein, variant 2 [Aphanomyces invadans]